ncbi:lipopolysaccharide heptosyltransferase I [Cupriavidus plantarum]|uniref:lipopolysaccharide heptosyltransferase I n=1 Tax=Cupriavidus plantarum TaxID=942865 RepID=UPI000E263DDE|nr:lipopolysaccharide heptosyltransferase I [Cupriavidus plantarum]REE85229.1 heptosyltransferase-1 [Cupriavidus plantarum]
MPSHHDRATQQPAAAQNVLIVRTSSMGDLVHTLPAITELKAHHPHLSISWLTEAAFADIPALHPGISEVIPITWRRWRSQLLHRATWRELGALRRKLRDTPWKMVLDCQGLFKSAAFAALAGGPLVVGYDHGSVRERIACLFYQRRHPVSWRLSAVQRNRRLFAAAFGYHTSGVPDFGLTAGPRPPWLQTGPYAVMLHATSRIAKAWPETMWTTLGRRLHAEQGLRVVLPWGSATERQRSERLAAAIPDATVAPHTRIKEAASLIGHATAVIGVDTGLTHLANALNVPLVALYTDTDPAQTGVVESPRAMNLGNVAKCPTVENVWHALRTVRGEWHDA